MQDIYLTFEFERIKEMVKEFAKTELGRLFCDEIKSLDSEEAVFSSKEDLKEMCSLYLRFGPLPISSSANILHMIDMAKKSGLLTPRDLYFIAEDVKTISLINKYLSKVDVSYPRILSKKEKFSDLTNLEKEIRRVINSSLTVVDTATPDLKEIRLKLKKEEALLNSKIASIALSYSSYLNDGNVTLRDGHFVLPVKTAYKNKVMGIVFDVSDTGNTTFIEPFEITQANNEITSLKIREAEEVRKVLKNLTNLVLIQEAEVLNNNTIIAELDFLQAKAIFANTYEAIIAEDSKTQMLDLVEAKHPLIDRKKVVANSYHLDEEKRIVIISGPNAGGKTVSLKTVGLLALMNQSGLPVTAKKATFSFYPHIYIDIGDNQSLSDNLSTFSAHISQIAEITNAVKGKDLVLLDELGTGTDPKEGEVIAISVIKHLESKHALAMVSSHFGKLKEYAFLSTHIENSSMVFDEKNLLPTYIFKLGVPGKSYALDVASRFSLNENIIKEAKSLLSEEKDNDSTLLLATLQKKVEENTFLEEKLKREQFIMERDKKALEIAKNNLQKQKETLLEVTKKEKEQLIEDAKAKIDEILSMMSKGDLKLHEVIEIKQQLDELNENNQIKDFDEDIQINDFVSIPSLDIQGTVKRLNGNKATINTTDGLTIEVNKIKLHKEQKEIVVPKKNQKSLSSKLNYEDKINTSVGLELNIIGLRFEEAQTELVKYLDRCRVKHLKQVRIIHGFGSGILRNMTHNYLKNQKDLKFRLGDAYEGGGGATIVIFND